MKSLIQLFALMKPYWKVAMLGPLLMVLEVSMDLFQPRLMQHIVDDGIAQLDYTLILHTSLLMILLAFFGVFGGFGGGVFAVRASQLFGADLRSKVYRKIQALPFSYLDKLGTGELTTRLTNDVTQVQDALFMCLHLLIRAPLIIVGSVIMSVVTSPELAMMFLVLAPTVALVLLLVIRKTYATFGVVQQRVDQLNTVMLENFAGVRVVKAFVRDRYENKRFDRSSQQLKGEMITALRVAALTMPSTMLILNVGIVCVIWFGGLQVTAGTLKTGQVIAFINYIMYLLQSVMLVGMLITRVSRAAASATRIQEVLSISPEQQYSDQSEPDNRLDPQAIQGRIVFDHVSFDYKDSEHDKPVLNGISFTAEPNQVVAILGATGAGKSSLVNLIPRFYDVSAGAIYIDGRDVKEYPRHFLRTHISIAMQEAVLFSGSIRDNICYGNPDASMAEVISAAKAAQAYDFIIKLPDGFDTNLGQRGVNLSGGQKQRLAIARALVTQPKILILDDSTSAVDVETEARLQTALAELMKGRTSIIIAQRISTVLSADKIIVLDNGRVAAEGTHRELLGASPIYDEIFDSQLGYGVLADV